MQYANQHIRKDNSPAARFRQVAASGMGGGFASRRASVFQIQ